MSSERIAHEIKIAADRDAAAVARARLRGLDHPILQARIDDAAVALSEVVTNAIRHGGLHHGADELRLIVAAAVDRLRVIVEQPTAAAGVGIVEPRLDPANPGGFGLRMVDQLTDLWGHDPGPPGQVWFELS